MNYSKFTKKETKQQQPQQQEQQAQPQTFSPYAYVDKNEPITSVQIDGLVVLKIVKHCKESLPDLVNGQLLGLDFDGVLEITNSYPLPRRGENEGEDDINDTKYQREMMKCLREVNVDSNTVGWYQSSYLESYINPSTIENLYQYQQEFGKKCVCLVFDPIGTSKGNLSLKALRLSDKFLSVYTMKPESKDQKTSFTQENITKAGLTAKDIFEELPIKFHNPRLIDALLLELDVRLDIATNTDFERLDLTTAPFLEKAMDSIIECIDDLSNDNQRYLNYIKSVNKQQQYIQKKREQGADEESLNIKPIQQPARLESLLTTSQINNYCEEITHFAGQAANKLYLAEGLHRQPRK